MLELPRFISISKGNATLPYNNYFILIITGKDLMIGCRAQYYLIARFITDKKQDQLRVGYLILFSIPALAGMLAHPFEVSQYYRMGCLQGFRVLIREKQ